MEVSQMIIHNERGIPNGKSMKTETATWSEFPSGGKVIAEQIIVSEEINKSKRAEL